MLTLKNHIFYFTILFPLSIKAVVYQYDQLNRLTQASYETGEVISYSYDKAGNLLEVTLKESGAIAKPNLKPYHRPTWEDTIVINDHYQVGNEYFETIQTFTHETGDTLKTLFAYSFENDSSVDITDSNAILSYVYLNDNLVRMNVQALPAHGKISDRQAQEIFKNAGQYHLKIVLDPENMIDESNENDNVYEKIFYVMLRDGDSDNNGINDIDEGTDDIDYDGIVNFLDDDNDGDGILDINDNNMNLADSDIIVKDQLTGLYWQKYSSYELYRSDWVEAVAYCNQLQYASFKNWRLPTLKELRDAYQLRDIPLFETYMYNPVSLWSSNSDQNGYTQYIYGPEEFSYSDAPKDAANYVQCVRENVGVSPAVIFYLLK